MKIKIGFLSLLLAGIILIGGCVNNSPEKTSQYNAEYIKKNAADLNGIGVSLKGTVAEWCLTNSAMWMDGSFRDASGEIPLIFNGANEHRCSDANYTADKVEYAATIEATINHNEMADNLGNSVGIVTFLEVNSISEQ